MTAADVAPSLPTPAAGGPRATPSGRRRGRPSPSERRERNAALRFISPWIVGFLVFTAWPIVYSAYLSFTDYDVINDPTFVGLENYREMAQDPKVALSLWNTLVYTVVQVPLYTIVGLALALLLNQAGRSAGFFRTAFFGSGNTTYSNDAALFYVIYLFQQAFEFLHMGYASALAMLLFLIVMLVTAVQVWLSRRYVHYTGGAR